MATITRKITLFPQGDKAEIDRVYKYLRNGMEFQAQMMNQCISAMYTAKLNKISTEEWKELKKLYSHRPGSSKGSPYEDPNGKFPTGLPVAGAVPRACEAKFKKACQDGLMYGKVSLPTYKKDMPLMVHNDYVNLRGSKKNPDGSIKCDLGLYSGQETPGAIVDALYNNIDPDLHIKFANNITFDVVLGSIHKSLELRSVFEKIFAGEYKICDSSIGFDKKSGKKILLYLVLETPTTKHELDENTVVGVDLGLAVPAVCALNNDPYHREYIGDWDDFTRQRVKLQQQRKAITRRLKNTNGGHGRADKLRHLDKLDIHERNFAHTYNHMVSRKVIEFALKYNAKYINLENLAGFSEDEKHQFVLRNWSYYELQQMIVYKAAKEGIEVRFINPAYTSQTCSICGHRGIRSSQAVFTCSDPDCKVHTMYTKPINADFNGARNIAMSQDFVTDENESKTNKQSSTSKGPKAKKQISTSKQAKEMTA